MSQVDKTAERKEKLIEATVQIIAEHGLENLRTAEVCKIAGVNVAYLYDLFENKDDLIAQAFAASDERSCITGWQAALPPPSPCRII